jgi:hypothetical protein
MMYVTLTRRTQTDRRISVKMIFNLNLNLNLKLNIVFVVSSHQLPAVDLAQCPVPSLLSLPLIPLRGG